MNNLPLLLLGGGVVYFMLNKNKPSSNTAQKSETPEVKVELKKEVSKPKPLPKKTNPDPVPSDVSPNLPNNAKEKPLDDFSDSVTLWDTTEPGLFQVVDNENSLPVFNVKVYSDQSKNAPLPLVLFVGPMNGIFKDPDTGLWVNRGESEMLKNLVFPETARYAFIRPIKYEKEKTFYTELYDVIFKDELRLYQNHTFNEALIFQNKFLDLAAAELMLAVAKLKNYFSTTKVYIVGYSTGSVIVYKLIDYLKHNYPNPEFPLSGIMTIGGFHFPVYGADYGKQPPSKNIPLISVHGMKDPYVLLGKGKSAYDNYDGPKLGFVSVPFADHSLEQLKPAINQSLKALMKNT